MTDGLAMYGGVLYELNKHQSPDFEVEDFNHFMGMSIEKWLKNELQKFELNQVVTDSLAPLIKVTTPELSFNATDATDVREKDLPEDYRHVVSCLVTLRHKVATTGNIVGTKRRDFTKRLTGDSWAAIYDNSYFRPLVADSDMRLYHRIVGNKVGIYFDTVTYPNTTVVIETIKMEYISQPTPIELDTNLTVTSDTVFSESVNRALVVICADLFLENNQSQRLQSHAVINK